MLSIASGGATLSLAASGAYMRNPDMFNALAEGALMAGTGSDGPSNLPISGVSTTGAAICANSGKVEQYALRALESGWYPVMKRGSKVPVAITWLEKGEVWKFGTTKNPATRYSGSFLRNTGTGGLGYSTEWKGTTAEVLQLEKMKIENYRAQYGALPPGNKVVE